MNTWSVTEWLEQHRLAFLSFFALTAAIRVIVFCAAFPFFGNVDEQLQTDMVLKYAAGQVPRSYELVGHESAILIARYGSPEFLATQQRAAEAGLTSPLWKRPELAEAVDEIAQDFQARRNFESSQPPLYYVIAGIWTNLGRALSFSGLRLLYWIRFLNAVLALVIVLMGYFGARMLSDDPAVYLSVPLLLAFIPQDSFYSIQNDNLSAVLGAIGTIMLLKWLVEQPVTIPTAIITGVVIAAAYVTKIANLPFVCVAVAAVIFAAATAETRLGSGPFLACLIAAAIPICVWMLWCRENFGDLTGSTGKIASLTWTRKSFSAWWPHPIFTPGGLWNFLSTLLARFWRGEFSWHGEQLRSHVADWFYAISSLLFPAIALITARRAPPEGRRALFLCGTLFLSGIAFLGLLSVQFDFGRCIYPSRQFPYFTSGRLMLFSLVPFAILYVWGIASLFRWLRLPLVSLAITATIALLVTLNEILISRGVFSSAYNWFHG